MGGGSASELMGGDGGKGKLGVKGYRAPPSFHMAHRGASWPRSISPPCPLQEGSDSTRQCSQLIFVLTVKGDGNVSTTMLLIDSSRSSWQLPTSKRAGV